MAPPAATGEAKDLKGGRGNDNREQASNSTGYGSSSCMRAAFLCLLVPASGNGADLVDYSQTVEQVMRAEAGPRTGEELADIAQHHYQMNPAKLAAHCKAARLINSRGKDASARMQVALSRGVDAFGADVMHQLIDIFDTQHAISNDTFKERDSNSAWLTRFLAGQGYSVTRSRSKMDASCGR